MNNSGSQSAPRANSWTGSHYGSSTASASASASATGSSTVPTPMTGPSTSAGPSAAVPNTLVQTALVSGHTDLTPTEFSTHYIPKLDAALASGHRFIMGDAPGADSMALSYLLSASHSKTHPNIRQRITIYPFAPHKVSQLQARGVQVVPPWDARLKVERSVEVVLKHGPDARRWKHIQRDANMTYHSDYDVLWFRSKEQMRALYGARYRERVSATELNFRRRRELARLAAAAAAVTAEKEKTVKEENDDGWTVVGRN